MKWALVLALVSGCYRPGTEIECSVACSAEGDCPVGATCGGDRFCHAADEQRMCGDARMIDGAADAPTDGLVDGRLPDAVGAVCPFSGGYKWVSQGSTWQAAEAACKGLQIGGSTRYVHLATISDVNELMNISATVHQSGTPWVGVTSLQQQGSFLFVTAEPFSPNNLPWDAGQPDNDATQRCARMQSTGMTLDNDDCGVPYGYICECDDWPEQPANFP